MILQHPAEILLAHRGHGARNLLKGGIPRRKDGDILRLGELSHQVGRVQRPQERRQISIRIARSLFNASRRDHQAVDNLNISAIEFDVRLDGRRALGHPRRHDHLAIGPFGHQHTLPARDIGVPRVREQGGFDRRVAREQGVEGDFGVDDAVLERDGDAVLVGVPALALGVGLVARREDLAFVRRCVPRN